MIEKIKLSLRITTDAFDTELADLMAACLDDLRAAGVSPDVLEAPEAYPLIVRAVVTYCRANFGAPADADRMKASYDEQKALLTLAGAYNERG